MTPLQIETLRLIDAGKVVQHRCGHAAWRVWGGNPGTVGKLISAGLAKWAPFQPDEYPCLLTEAGRAALAAKETQR